MAVNWRDILIHNQWCQYRVSAQHTMHTTFHNKAQFGILETVRLFVCWIYTFFCRLLHTQYIKIIVWALITDKRPTMPGLVKKPCNRSFLFKEILTLLAAVSLVRLRQKFFELKSNREPKNFHSKYLFLWKSEFHFLEHFCNTSMNIKPTWSVLCMRM